MVSLRLLPRNPESAKVRGGPPTTIGSLGGESSLPQPNSLYQDLALVGRLSPSFLFLICLLTFRLSH